MKNPRLNKIIAKRICQLRTKQGLSIEKLAYQSGISKGGLSEIERNKKQPTILTVLKICAGLKITMSEFFDFEEIEYFLTEL